MTTTWKAGAAMVRITPAESMWLAGWAVRTEPARGTLTELYAKALAIEDKAASRLVLLTVDLIAISREIAATVADQVRHRWGLRRDQLIICASHTHCGPEIRPDKVPFFHIPSEYARKIEPYVAWLINRLADVVGTAISELQPAHLFARQTTATFAHNRRGAAAVDHSVPVLEVTAVDGRRRAIVIGYACHNIAMPPEDGRYCGDYAGFAQSVLEAQNETVALFVAGAGADQNPEPRGSVELTRKHGESLAQAVQQCLTTPGTELTGTLTVAYEEVLLDFQPLPTREVLEAGRASNDLPTRTKAEFMLAHMDQGECFAKTYPCPLQVARFGETLMLIAIGGEPVIDFAHECRRRYANSDRIIWVAGYANDMFGYVPTARVLREGGYEGSRSVLWSALPAPFAEDTEKRVMAGIDRLVKKTEVQ